MGEVMKRGILIYLLIGGCVSNPPIKSQKASYTTSMPDSVCAALGIMKASNNMQDFNDTRLTVKQRIEEGRFNITARECEDIALNSIGAYKLISVNTVLI